MPGERAIKKGNVLMVYYRLSCEHYIQNYNHGNSDYPFNKKINYFNFILIPKITYYKIGGRVCMRKLKAYLV